MAVVINCEWCNKTMGTVKSLAKAKDWDQGEVCQECQDKRAKVEKTFISIVERTKNKAELLREEAVNLLEKEVKAIAGGA